MEIESKELRDIILGKITFRKCPMCYGEGNMFWTEASEDNCSKRTYEEAGGWGVEGNSTDWCDTCNGVGFIQDSWS